MLPDFPKIKQAAYRYFIGKIDECSSQGALLNEIPTVQIYEGDASISISVDGHIDDSKLQEISGRFQVTDDDVIQNGIGAFLSKTSMIAEELAGQKEKIIIRKIEQVTDQTGNVVDAKGQELSPSMLLDVMDKMAIDFDDKGNIKNQVLVMHPNQVEKFLRKAREWEKDPEFVRKREALIEKKRKEWRDREDNRKLVD